MLPYENPALPVDERVTDLLARMTLDEKAALMFHTMVAVNPDGTLHEPSATKPPASRTLVFTASTAFPGHATQRAWRPSSIGNSL